MWIRYIEWNVDDYISITNTAAWIIISLMEISEEVAYVNICHDFRLD